MNVSVLLPIDGSSEKHFCFNLTKGGEND